MNWSKSGRTMEMGAVIATTALVLAACGGSSHKSGSSDKQDSTVNGNAQKLSAALLSASEVPGFQEINTPPKTQVVSSSNQNCTQTFNGPNYGLGNVGKPVDEEVRTFQDANKNTMGVSVSEYTDPNAGTTLLQQLQSAAPGCRSWSDKDSTGEVTNWNLQSSPTPIANTFRGAMQVKDGNGKPEATGDTVVLTKGKYSITIVLVSPSQNATISAQTIQAAAQRLATLN